MSKRDCCASTWFASARSVIPDLTLDLIGPCGYPARKILDTLISECDLNNSVTWHGPMTRREVIERMSGYAAMILLSKNESFGLVYAEAVLSGIPIVYLRGSGVDGYDLRTDMELLARTSLFHQFRPH